MLRIDFVNENCYGSDKFFRCRTEEVGLILSTIKINSI